MSLGPFGGGTGVMHIDPVASEIARFAGNAVQLTGTGTTATSGVAGWDDTKVPYCLNAFCGQAIVDTGGNTASIAVSTAAQYTALGISNGSTTFPPGTSVTESLATSASWTFVVSHPAVVAKDAFLFGSGTAIGDNLGQAPFYQEDLLYDYNAGTISFAAKH
jgi:hypothetical protein